MRVFLMLVQTAGLYRVSLSSMQPASAVLLGESSQPFLDFAPRKPTARMGADGLKPRAELIPGDGVYVHLIEQPKETVTANQLLRGQRTQTAISREQAYRWSQPPRPVRRHRAKRAPVVRAGRCEPTRLVRSSIPRLQGLGRAGDRRRGP